MGVNIGLDSDCGCSWYQPLTTPHSCAGVFEGNVVTHSAQELERIAQNFCAERVGILLDDGVAAFHGPMARDWALKGEESASMNSIIRCPSGPPSAQHAAFTA